jgi:N-acylneuraminate cytidylyltransferase
MEIPTDREKQKVRLLAIIPARGGSKGLPRKNLLLAGGKPLIAWTIDVAKKSKYISSIALTSDDDEIIEVGKVLGCDYLIKRPIELATDTASSVDVVLHALSELPDYDYVILLQPTSPLRTSTDIDAAFDLLKSSNVPCCLSVTEAEQSPYWMYRLDEAGKMTSLLSSREMPSRRQDLPSVFILNGAIYIANVSWLIQSKSFFGGDSIGYQMPKNRSIDIDTIDDFNLFCSKVEGSCDN